MEWQISYLPEKEILLIKTTGVLEIDSATQMRNAGYEQLKQYHCFRCLLDHRQAEADHLSTLDIYFIPQIYHEMQIPHQMRMAMLVPPEMLDNLRFYETVCQNNGYQVSLFLEEPAAIQWLTQ